MARFEYRFNGEYTAGEWFQDNPVLTLPDELSPLKEQREAVRALNLLFPSADVKLLSHTDLDDGSVVTRVVKMKIKNPRRKNG